MAERNRFREAKTLQTVFWCVVYVLSAYFFVNVTDWTLGLLKSTFSVLMLMVLFYTNYWYLSPRFYEQKRYWLYLALVLGLIFLMTLLRLPIERYMLTNNGFPIRVGMVRVLPWIIFISNGTMAILSFTARHADLGYQLEQLKKETENKQLQAELNFLKAQINPHFLFNTLNNIYTLALLKSDEAPEMIAKLAELMRYLIYESDTAKVPLRKEVDFLTNYIALYRLKYGNHQRLSFEVKAPYEHAIEPMLFVSLVENCFKYANLDKPESFINIRIESTPNQVNLCAANSIDRKPTTEDVKYGVGLSNLKQRLALLYPQKHDLQIRSDEAFFEVTLTLHFQP